MRRVVGGAAARSSVPVSSGGNYRPGGLAQALGAMSPTEQARVGSGYGERTSSRTGRVTFHAGWDFVAPRGTPIYAADAGEVVVVARDQPGGAYRGYGNAVVTFHPEDDTYVLYAHLDRADVRVGDQVAQGQQIGVAGNTTNGRFPRMPPHLHVETRHAKPDGSSPFPGPYGRYNLDPLDWFQRRGLTITNRWGRPPGTLGPGGSGEISGLEQPFGPCPHGRMGRCPYCPFRQGLGTVEWWETVFYERAPEGAVYEPEQSGSALVDWIPSVAGGVLLLGAAALGRRR